MTQHDREPSRLTKEADDAFNGELWAAKRGSDFEIAVVNAALDAVKVKTRQMWTERADAWRKA